MGLWDRAFGFVALDKTAQQIAGWPQISASSFQRPQWVQKQTIIGCGSNLWYPGEPHLSPFKKATDGFVPQSTTKSGWFPPTTSAQRKPKVLAFRGSVTFTQEVPRGQRSHWGGEFCLSNVFFWSLLYHTFWKMNS